MTREKRPICDEDVESSRKNVESSRRVFMSTTARFAVGCASAGVCAGLIAFAHPRREARTPVVLPYRALAIGSLVFIKEHALFLLRTREGIGAVSARCTHLGCIVRQGGEGLICPCHGATYDKEGRAQSGPARRDLPWFAVSVLDDGRVSVELSREVPAGSVSALGPNHTRQL